MGQRVRTVNRERVEVVEESDTEYKCCNCGQWYVDDICEVKLPAENRLLCKRCAASFLDYNGELNVDWDESELPHLVKSAAIMLGAVVCITILVWEFFESILSSFFAFGTAAQISYVAVICYILMVTFSSYVMRWIAAGR